MILMRRRKNRILILILKAFLVLKLNPILIMKAFLVPNLNPILIIRLIIALIVGLLKVMIALSVGCLNPILITTLKTKLKKTQ